MRRSRNNTSGMTLVEIMVATFILLIIFGIVFVMLFGGLRSWFFSMDYLDIQQSARIGLESICFDLYAARPSRPGSRDWHDIIINDPNVPLPQPPVAHSLRFTVLQRDSYGDYFEPFALTNYAANANLFNNVLLPPAAYWPADPDRNDPFYHTVYYYHDTSVIPIPPPFDRFLALYNSHLGPGNKNPAAPADYAVTYFVNAGGNLMRGIFRFGPQWGYMGLHPSSRAAATDIQSVIFTGYYNKPQGLVVLDPLNLDDTNPDVVDISITAARTTRFGDNLTYSLKTRVFLRGSNDDSYYY